MTDERLDHLHRHVSEALRLLYSSDSGAIITFDEAVRTAMNAAYQAGRRRAIGQAEFAVAKLSRRAWFGWVRAKDVTVALDEAFEEDRV